MIHLHRPLLVLFVVAMLQPVDSAFAADAERDRVLEGARKEGRLVLYAGMDTDEATLITNEFSKKYPFIKSEIFRSSGEKIQARFLVEHGERTLADDVVVGHDSVRVLPADANDRHAQSDPRDLDRDHVSRRVGVGDGLVPHDQSREMQVRLRQVGIPVEFFSAVTHGPNSEAGTTLDGYASPVVPHDSPFAGHGSETSNTQLVIKTGFDRLAGYFNDGATPTCRESVVDGTTGLMAGLPTTGC